MSDLHALVSFIDQWPTLSDFARDAGVTYGAAKQMRRRCSIPVDYWPSLIASERGKAAGVTADGLMKLHADAAALGDTSGTTEAA